MMGCPAARAMTMPSVGGRQRYHCAVWWSSCAPAGSSSASAVMRGRILSSHRGSHQVAWRRRDHHDRARRERRHQHRGRH
jgi:hypothetical protein